MFKNDIFKGAESAVDHSTRNFNIIGNYEGHTIVKFWKNVSAVGL